MLIETIKNLDNNSSNDVLIESFNEEMRYICDESDKNGYHPVIFRGMMAQLGGITAAEKLAGKEEWSEGLTILWEKNRWDLTLESVILKDSIGHCLVKNS